MIDRELQEFLTDWNRAWSNVADDAPLSVRRALFEELSEAANRPLPPGIESKNLLIRGEGRSIRVKVFRPDCNSATPCLIYMHGGGWIQGSPETHDEITAEIAEKNHQTVISVDYALAPEHPFPAAINDCATVIRWVFANATALRVDERKIAVGGDSAGANLAAAMALAFRGSSPPLIGQLLFYPPVDFVQERPSFIENAAGPVLTSKAFAEMVNLYVAEKDRTNPLAAPLQAADLVGLPAAFIAVAEHDPLRDDGHAFAERLVKAGGNVRLHHGIGLVHGYLRAISLSTAARAAFDEGCAWMGELNQL